MSEITICSERIDSDKTLELKVNSSYFLIRIVEVNGENAVVIERSKTEETKPEEVLERFKKIKESLLEEIYSCNETIELEKDYLGNKKTLSLKSNGYTYDVVISVEKDIDMHLTVVKEQVLEKMYKFETGLTDAIGKYEQIRNRLDRS